MKNSILNLGKALNEKEQKQITGGYPAIPDSEKQHSGGGVCFTNGQPHLCID